MRGWSVAGAGLLVVALAPSCSSSSSKDAATGADGGASGSGSGGASGSSGGGSSGGGSGSSSGGGSGGSSGSSGSGSGGGTDGGGTCLGASLLGALGKSHMLVGLANDSKLTAAAPFDVQYQYISGEFSDGAGPCTSCTSGCTVTSKDCTSSPTSGCWWGCWQDTSQPPGEFPASFAGGLTSASPPQIPMFTYYMLLQASGVTEGAPEITQAAGDASFMSRYFADWRFLLQRIGQSVALLHIEPDFWGYAEQQSEDPTSLKAAVASANGTDCGSMPNTIAGMGQCMIAMTRKYAPHALVGLQASAWGTNVDALGNTDPTLDVASVAQKTAKFLAACGESSADFVVVETSDRDAGYYQVVEKKTTWWDATNAKLPDFTQAFTYVKALTEALSKPALYWQTPLGNMSLPNTNNEYQDNRVDYFFGHMSELAAAHAVGAVFGAGAGGCTTPDTDGGNLVTKAKAYYSGGGQSLCP